MICVQKGLIIAYGGIYSAFSMRNISAGEAWLFFFQLQMKLLDSYATITCRCKGLGRVGCMQTLTPTFVGLEMLFLIDPWINGSVFEA